MADDAKFESKAERIAAALLGAIEEGTTFAIVLTDGTGLAVISPMDPLHACGLLARGIESEVLRAAGSNPGLRLVVVMPTGEQATEPAPKAKA